MTQKKLATAMLFIITFMLVFSFVCPIVAYAGPTSAPATDTNDYSNPNAVEIEMDGGLPQVKFPGQGKDTGEAWKLFLEKYRAFITGFAGVGAVTMIVLFIISFLKLGTSAGNPNLRSAALQGCLWTGIAAALLGSVTFIVGFFYNAIG